VIASAADEMVARCPARQGRCEKAFYSCCMSSMERKWRWTF